MHSLLYVLPSSAHTSFRVFSQVQGADSLLTGGLLVVLVMLVELLLSRHGPVVSISAPAHFASQALGYVFLSLQHTGAYILAQTHVAFLGLSAAEVSALTLPSGLHSPLCSTLTPLHFATQELPCVLPSAPHTGSKCMGQTQPALLWVLAVCNSSLLLLLLLSRLLSARIAGPAQQACSQISCVQTLFVMSSMRALMCARQMLNA
jgi:hypothetical protein